MHACSDASSLPDAGSDIRQGRACSVPEECSSEIERLVDMCQVLL